MRKTALLTVLLALLLGCGDDTSAPGPASAVARATSQDCQECHQKTHDTYVETVAMARSFYPMTPDKVVEDWVKENRLHHAKSGNHYRMTRDGDRFFQERWQVGVGGKPVRMFRREVTHVMGSGNHVRTYVHRAEDGRTTQLPVSWYAESKTWAMSPGYDREVHDDFFRPLDHGCMFCHNGYPGEVEPPRDAYYARPLPSGIDCDRCHGDGTRHVELARQDPDDIPALRAVIVNPARLETRRRMDVCLQCHLETAVDPGIPHSLRRFDRRIFDFRPGEALEDYLIPFDSKTHVADRGKRFEIAHHGYRLMMSKCFTESGGKLVCTTCHDAHHTRPIEERKEAFRAACDRCHDADACTEDHGRNRSGTDPDDCTTCHMPKRRTIDVVHAVMTDHRIVKRPPPGDLLAPLSEDHHAYEGELVFHLPDSAPKGAEAKLYLGTAYLQAGRADLGIPLIEASRAEGARQYATPWYMVSVARAREGDKEGAVTALELAVELDPDQPGLHAQLGAALLNAGRLDDAKSALEVAIAASPRHSDALAALASIAHLRGNPDRVAELLVRAVDAEPDHVRARRQLAAHLSRTGDREGAIPHLVHALAVSPADTDIETDLAHLHLSLRRNADALRHANEVLHRRPGHDRAARLAVSIMALSSDPSLRNGPLALRRARDLVARQASPSAGDLSLLAAAHAEAGDFRAAITHASRASALAGRGGDLELSRRIKARIRSYSEGRPLYDQ